MQQRIDRTVWNRPGYDHAVDARLEAAKCGVNLAVMLRSNGHFDEVVQVAGAVAARLSAEQDVGLRKQLVKATMVLARANATLGNTAVARHHYDWLLAHNGNELSTTLRATLERENVAVSGGPWKAAFSRLKRHLG